MALGWPDVDLLEDSITDHQLREWQEFFSIEPWGSEPGFFQTGIIAATIVNTSPNRKQGAKAASPGDFIPDFGQARQSKGSKPIRADLMAAFVGRNRKADNG